MSVDTDNATVVLTGVGIEIFRLAAARGAIKLEGRGLRFKGGRSLRKGWAVKMGLPANAKRELVIDVMTAEIERLKADVAEVSDRDQ